MKAILIGALGFVIAARAAVCAQAPPPSPSSPGPALPPALQASLDETKVAALAFHASLPPYVEETVKQEVLTRLSDPSPCAKKEAADAKSRRTDRKEVAVDAFRSLKAAWKKLKAVSAEDPATARPWNEDQMKRMDKAITEADGLMRQIGQSRVVQTSRLHPDLERRCNAYASNLLAQIGSQASIVRSMLPSSVDVPCEGMTISK